MLTIAIPQLYHGASGKKGAYNRQEVGLARAFAALGCRAVVLYPAPGAAAPEKEELEPNVRIWYLPARAFGVNAFYKSWQVLLAEGVDAVHLMGDNSLAVPGLYRFCRRHGIFLYNQLGAVQSAAGSAAVRCVMDLLCRRNLAVYRKTPTFAKTPALAAELEGKGVPCSGVLPVGLDTAIIPLAPGTKAEARQALGLLAEGEAQYLIFVGRLDAYKRPLDLAPLLAALPQNWHAVIIGDGAQRTALHAALEQAGVLRRCVLIESLPNTQVQLYYHACDVFVNLSDKEIFGMSLLEAMYAACVPVARHAPGPDFIIEDGRCGLLAGEPVAEVAAAVLRAAARPDLAEAAQKRICDNFLWIDSAEKALVMLGEHGVR